MEESNPDRTRLTWTNLKRALVTAETDHQRQPGKREPELDLHPELRKLQRAGNDLVLDALRKAGLDTKKLGDLHGEHEQGLERLIDQR